MKSEKLLHAIGTIDDGLIFAARPAEKKKTPRTRIVWTAAAAAVLAAAFWILGRRSSV